MKKVLLSVVCILSPVFLCGCATTGVSSGRINKTVTIAGVPYISTEALSEAYNLDYHLDPFTKKAILTKNGEEIRIMAGSSVALLNQTAHKMDKEARFHEGSLVISQAFAYKKIAPLFREEVIPRATLLRVAGLPIKKIIIDPGHGGKDPGAVGRGGLKEKDVVLDVARRLRNQLKARGIDVIMTRDRDEFVSLSRRSQIANANRDADFFISIHANASRSRWVSGVEVFYLSETIDDNQRSLKAARDYTLNLKEDYSGKDTAAIIWDLIYSDDRKSSSEMAEEVLRALSDNLSQRNRGKKSARFYVLKETNIPAILIEVGFISNPSEEKKIKNTLYREKIAQAVSEGIVRYNHNFINIHTARH